MQYYAFVLNIFLIYTLCPHQVLAMLEDLEECADEVGLPEVKLKEVGHKKVLTTQTEKCFMACVYKKAGRMKDGKFNADISRLSPDKLKKLQACADEANKQTEECEIASVATTCLKTKMHNN